MAKQPVRADGIAGIAAGVVGLLWLSLIWVNLVFPPPALLGGGGFLTGSQVPLREHEWGFNQFSKGGPEICVPTGSSVTITLRNDGRNLHGFQVVQDGGVVIAGLNKTDVLRPGEVRQFTVNVTAPGDYLYICPVTGHRAKGMVAPFVVQSGCQPPA